MKVFLASIFLLLSLPETVLSNACGGSLTGLYGHFKSPGFPNNYPVETTCTWSITVPQGYRIRLTFTEFKIEENSRLCDYDRVNVTDPKGSLTALYDDVSQNCAAGRCHKSASPSVTGHSKLFCGTPLSDGPKAPFLSNGNALIVSLISDYSETEAGFVAHYEAIDVNECLCNNGNCSHFCHNYIGGYHCSCRSQYRLASDKLLCNVQCHGNVINLTSDECGKITSPEYPNNYPDKANCSWTIHVPAGNQIQINFTDFDVEDHHASHCPYDKVEVIVGNKKAGIHCGKSHPDAVISKANQIRIGFKSDDSVNHKGFELNYCSKRLVCGDPGKPANGERLGSYKYLDRVRFQCVKGFEIVGSFSRQCLASGDWSGTQPICRRKLCGNPGNPKHGQTTIAGGVERRYVYQDTIKSTCDQYYERESGVSTRLCSANGTWTGDPLKCKPICGERTYYDRGQIIGGESVPHGTYPWMALLFAQPCSGQSCAFCGGAVINNTHILTAAHCFPPQRGLSFVVRLGAHNWKKNTSQELWCFPKKIITHPSYVYDSSNPKFVGDVALIQIDHCIATANKKRMEEIVMSKHVRPVCLPNLTDISLYDVGEKAKVAGWGKKHAHKDTQSVVLKHTRLPIADRGTCEANFNQQGWKVIKDMMFCTVGNEGRDTCQGDSGGPLMSRRQNGKFVVIGIVSWGDSHCGSGYSVYSNVLPYVPWILY
eukprot:m.58895 g.58895  ORF g.58895 m.58895 type:complete len:711 (+) comp34843_c1_seq3:256-2388(+)